MMNHHRSERPSPLPVIGGTVTLDVARGTHHQLRARAAQLEAAPVGAALIVSVGALSSIDVGPDILAFLVTAIVERGLRVDVHGDPHAVRAWVDYLRDAVAAHLVSA